MLNLDFIRLFIFISGFVIGLGAVTVIDIHGFFRKKIRILDRGDKSKKIIWYNIKTIVYIFILKLLVNKI